MGRGREWRAPTGWGAPTGNARANFAGVMRVGNGGAVRRRPGGSAARGGGTAASRGAAWCVARGAGVMARSRGLPRVGLPDAAPCAAMRGARRRPRKTLSVCYLPSSAPRRWRGGAMGTSRPTAMPHEEGVRDAMPHEGCAATGRGMPNRTRRGRGMPCRTRGVRERRVGRGKFSGCASGAFRTEASVCLRV